jgi:predicted Zn-dependent peptidase
MEGTKTVTVMVMVGTGSKYETKNINGISHFLEHMMFKGTVAIQLGVDPRSIAVIEKFKQLG